jgi:uncharacterized membrane protein YhaH (DUF805 family)
VATSSRKGRIGQTQYWTIFGIYVVAVVGLIGFSFYSFATGELSMGVTAILPLAPLGLYFRVIEMRRCRDIGWPTFLPWLLFVVPLGFALFTGMGGLGSGIGPTVTALTVPLLISLIDFAFSIVIGCIATKDPGEDYAQIFGGEPQPARPVGFQEPRLAGAADEPSYDRFDEAIARALEARRTASAYPAPALASEPATITPSAHARAVASFGRKAI